MNQISKQYQQCTNCVLDTADPHITFDENGICDLCNDYNKTIKPYIDYGKLKDKLSTVVDKIKKDGKKRDFDCLIGMSGGVDSSYMLHLAVKEFGLRPLVFHVDGGWNSEIAVNNIQRMIDKLGLDLYTEVINWEEMKAFELALFKSGTPYLDIPQDHAFMTTLDNFADKYHIKYILNGGNYSSEFVSYPLKYYYYGTDMRFIKDILHQFCNNDMDTFPFGSIFKRKIWLKYFRNVNIIKLLNYFPYNVNEAKSVLHDEYGWKPYPQKHFESRFTKFFEGYWLYERFNYDVRRVQYSSLILSGQMSREEAIEKLSHKPYDEETIAEEFKYISTKLGVTVEDLQSFFNLPKKYYWDYKNGMSVIDTCRKAARFLGIYRAQVR